MFDPTTAHMAAPRRPADGQLLIMLQVEVSDENEAERAVILDLVRQAENDGEWNEPRV